MDPISIEFRRSLPVSAGMPSDNRVEIERARHALTLAAEGRKVAVVSGGDPGVFAMAAAVFEAIEGGDSHWRDLDIRVEPGITAMLAAAAEVGAPLGGDFCAVSLSDNLKSWETIERRLRAAAEGDFVIALYNPASKARPHQLGQAFELLRTIKPPQTVVLFVRKAATPETRCHRYDALAEADPALADMRTLVIIGAAATRLIPRTGQRPWVYTPRAETGMAR
jgi:precorrin-3B C17-methyltransferase